MSFLPGPNNHIAENARKKYESALKAGRLKRKPCAVCGAPKTQGHHEDYSKPLEVVWLCGAHHAKRHSLRYFLIAWAAGRKLRPQEERIFARVLRRERVQAEQRKLWLHGELTAVNHAIRRIKTRLKKMGRSLRGAYRKPSRA